MGEPDRPRQALLNYLRVQSTSDAQIRRLLYRAAADVRQSIISLGTGQLSFSDSVRLAQLRTQRTAILSRLWSGVGQEIVAGQARAATAAEATGGKQLSELLRGIPEPARAALKEGAEKASHLAVERAVARESGVGRLPLAQSVYRNAALSNGSIDRLINSGLARNLNARSLATEVSRFIRPDVPGGVSYAAQRLARTEINNSFHAATVGEWEDNPFVPGMHWHLSGSHPKSDECNSFAERNSDNLGPGVFKTNNVPAKPHPQCLCYITPQSLSDDDIVNGFVSGDYDDFMRRNNVNLPVGIRSGVGAAPVRAAAKVAKKPEAKSAAKPVRATAPSESAASKAVFRDKVDFLNDRDRQVRGRQDEIEEVLARQQKLMGDVIEDLKKVDTGPMAEAEFLAQYDEATRIIRINRQILDDEGLEWLEKKRVLSTKKGFHSSRGEGVTALDHTVSHELGHFLDDVVLSSPGTRRKVFDAIADEFKLPRPTDSQSSNNYFKWVKANKSVLGKSVSKYGAFNGRELLAEIWAEFSRGGSKTRPGVGKIGKMMQELAKGHVHS